MQVIHSYVHDVVQFGQGTARARAISFKLTIAVKAVSTARTGVQLGSAVGRKPHIEHRDFSLFGSSIASFLCFLNPN